jgi:hypothetical protein
MTEEEKIELTKKLMRDISLELIKKEFERLAQFLAGKTE